ncbi:uncharacterized protein [Apostichopus japonicus]|uniref:uncharacterized protein n=1 Tax=Stichopus japonicus TaxID=307972 RepID=UPI003AB67D7B
MSLSTLIECAAQESCCAGLCIWKEQLLYVVPTWIAVNVALLFYGIFRLLKRLLRKDTWMKRIKQTYIPLGSSWRIDCEYDISYSVTDNTQETNTKEPAENLLLVDESSSVHNVTNDDELVKALHNCDTEKRVLFVGESGIGKSHLFRSIAIKWANGQILKDVILIYLQLDHAPRGACVLKEFLKLMKRDNSKKEIYSLICDLQREKSIVLLDGISNWSRCCNTSSNNANTNVNFLTIEELLESDNTHFKKMKVWATSRNVEAMKVMKGNYTKVHLKGLNEENRKKFFNKFLDINSEEKIRRLSAKKRQQYKCKLIDQNKYKSILCDKDVLTRSPVVSWYLATVFCSEANTEDIKRRVETYCNDFPDMVKTTKALMESKYIDLDFDLLVCLLEVGGANDNDYMTCAMMLHLKKLVFNHIKHEYFQEAMLRLLKTLKETDRVIKSLTIYGACPIKLFSCLPKIEQRLVIHNFPFTEIDFIAVLRTLSHQKLTLEFHDTEVPETFPVIKLLDNYSTTNLSVFRFKGEENPAKLSWEEAVWTKCTTEEDIHPSLEENMV